MMSECDPTESENGLPALLDTGATALPGSEAHFHSYSDPPRASLDNNRTGLGLGANPGVAVRISGSCESVLTELDSDGSGEEALLLPCLAGSSTSPRGGRDKRGRRSRHSSSSDKDTLASPGKVGTCKHFGLCDIWLFESETSERNVDKSMCSYAISNQTLLLINAGPE